MKHWRQVLSLTGIACLLACVLVIAFRVQLLTGLASLLVVDDVLQEADMMFVLTGGVDTRPAHAAELYREGLAPKIAIAQVKDTPTVEMNLYPNATDVMVSVMIELGVPEKDIVILPFDDGVTSTYEEALALRDYTDEHAVEEMILVTSAFHTRRGRWTLERALAESSVTLQVSAATEKEYDETNWWQGEDGLMAFTNETVKLFYYWVSYR